jgi:hypothetical protein
MAFAPEKDIKKPTPKGRFFLLVRRITSCQQREQPERQREQPEQLQQA